MKLLEIIRAAENLARDEIEQADTLVLRWVHGFAEHPLAGLAGAVLFDRESEGLARGEYPRGFVRQRDFENSLKPIIKREQWKRDRPEWRKPA